jgi:RHS repeat-associated protein
MRAGFTYGEPSLRATQFTGKERDSESGNDYFGARYYGSGLGRFLTPDWAAKPTTVPYASFGNPQSLNLYSYVQSNPTTMRDPASVHEKLTPLRS